MLLDPEWVNLDGFAVLGGTPVSNSSAGKPDLMTLLTRTSWNRICNLRALLMGLKPFSTACRKPVLSSWIYCKRKHFFVLLRSSLVKWILILAKIKIFFAHLRLSFCSLEQGLVPKDSCQTLSTIYFILCLFMLIAMGASEYLSTCHVNARLFTTGPEKIDTRTLVFKLYPKDC